MAAKKAAVKPKPVARRATAKSKTAARRTSARSKPAANKTVATSAKVETYLAAIKDAGRRNDCAALCALMAKATRCPPQMWGASIVGFGSYHYRYDSGREGDFMLVGFSSRASEVALYGLRAAPNAAMLLAKLGKHKEAKGCVYVKTLADVDLKVLEQLVATAAVAKKKEDVGAS